MSRWFWPYRAFFGAWGRAILDEDASSLRLLQSEDKATLVRVNEESKDGQGTNTRSLSMQV